MATVTSSNGQSATSHLTVQIGYNWPTIDAIPPHEIAETRPLVLAISATDADMPSQTLTFSLESGAPAGASIDSRTGVFSWTPTRAQGPGINSITVRVTDSSPQRLSATQTFTVIVIEVNDPPVIAAIPNQTINEGSALSLTVSVTDADLPQQKLTFALDAGSPTGASIDPATGIFNWTPSEAQGPSTNVITVKVTDNGVPPLSDTKRFTVIVNEVNLAPVLAVPATQTINELSTLTVTSVATDVDIPANALTFALVSAPTGVVIDPVTGILSWTPTEAQGPNTYVITVKVADNGVPALSATNSFTVVVNEVNSPPVLTALGTQTIAELSTLTVTNVATDVDIPANVLTFNLVSAPSGVSLHSASGVLTWTPSEVQGPSTNVITVRVTDNGVPSLSATNSFSVIVQEVNSPPTLAAIADPTIDEGVPLSFTVGATDGDLPAQQLTFSLEPSAPTGASIDPASGIFNWTPTEVQGPSTNVITVKVTDNGVPPLSDTKTFTVIVNEVNSSPILTVPGTQTINELSILTVTNVATDMDIPANALNFGLVSAPTGVVIDPVTGVLTWTPSEAQGPSTNIITVKVTDNGVPPLSATNRFTVVVNEVNSPPVLTALGTQTIAELSTLTVTNTATDVDIPANILTFSLVSAPTGVSLNPANGVLTWTPTEVQGPSTNVITVRVTDNGVPSLSATNSFSVIVQEVNSPPTLAAIADRTIDEGAPLSFTVGATDGDLPAQQLTFSLDPGVPTGARIDPASGIFSWTPNEEQGPSTTRITVRVTDSGVPSLSDTKAFTVVVNEVNSPPTIVSITDKFVEEKTKLEFKIDATDPDIPKNGLTFSLAADAPAGASLDAKTGLFTWVVGEIAVTQTNKITVRVTDDGAPSMAATNTFQVVITPSKLRLAPITDRAVDEGEVISFLAAVMDSPLARPPLAFSLEAGAPEGALISPGSGAFLWQPTEAQGPNTNTITVRVTDSSSPPLTATRSFTVIVREVNRPPVLDAIAPQSVVAGQPLRLTITARDPDLPANELSYSLDPGAPAGASIDAKSGLFLWTPSPLAASSTNFVTVRVTDNGVPPLSATSTFTVVVTEVPPPKPPKPPKLSAAILLNGQLQLTLNGEVGRIYLIQASPDLLVWEPMTNILSAAATFQVVDPAPSKLRQRFYRVLSR